MREPPAKSSSPAFSLAPAPPTREEALSWEHASDAEWRGLFARAAAARDERLLREGRPGVVTYSRKVFVPLTNLCRNECGYCVFVKRPGDSEARWLEPDEVLSIVREGEKLGCREALVSLGERPERRYEAARRFLAGRGFGSTIEYVRFICELILRETSLLPHVNAGTLSEDEMRLLRPFAVSQGLMLENLSPRFGAVGMPHHASPDKAPAARLATLAVAAKLCVPFTTGVLIGIGETWSERIDTILGVRDAHGKGNMVQEVIIQNFRRKEGIALADSPEPGLLEMKKSLAVARLLLPLDIAVQAPPNLMPGEYGEYLACGLDDWGGVSPLTADHINPERAWPAIEELRAVSSAQGFRLRERLAAHPRFIRDASVWFDPGIADRLVRRADAGGLARDGSVR